MITSTNLQNPDSLHFIAYADKSTKSRLFRKTRLKRSIERGGRWKEMNSSNGYE